MESVQDTLNWGILPMKLRLEGRKLETIYAGFRAWQQKRDLRASEDDAEQIKSMVLYLLHDVNETLEKVYFLRSQWTEFESRYVHAVSDSERQTHILNFTRLLGASRAQLAADRRAFNRWFGHDALMDRYQRELGQLEQHAAFALERLGVLSERLITQVDDNSIRIKIFRALMIDKKIEPVLTYDGDPRVRIQAFACLAAALRGLPREARETQVKSNILQFIYRSALDQGQTVWIQTEALALLQHLSAKSFVKALNFRLRQQLTGDDIFVRRRVVQLLGERLEEIPELQDSLDKILTDKSPFVRQALANILGRITAPKCLQLYVQLSQHDSAVQVRAAALLALPDILQHPAVFADALAAVSQSLQIENDSFVMRVLLLSIVQSHARLLNQHDKALADQWQTHLLPCLEHLHRTAADLSVRRWAARSREKLWCQSSESRLALKQELVKIARSTAAGSSSRLPDKLLKEHDINDIGRVLSLMAETDFTYSLQQNTFSTRLHRGDKFGFRSWRFLHELFNPATDKRQAFSHTHGRIAQGSIRAQAGYLAEQTETRVPGEPVYFESEDGRRPYLPLVDDLIACLDERIGQASLRFFSSEGITELRAPAGFTARLRARTILTLRFASYARLRNWQESSDWNADAYTAGLKKLGFEIHFQSYPDRQIDWRPDPAVEQFFPAVIPFFDSNISDDFKQYFFSVYENTLYELSLFLAAVGLFFFGHHILIHRKIRQARKRLPLVIGGWGTRGKSGSERIKAALFNALGYSIVGKTTGTEAMFLHGSRFGQLSEMFLFRPYDKATIWEQANLVVLADKLDTDVFLWECMGLTPAYVRILQQDWMQDDLMTITNTYPDHEDIQGPAGVNIPEVMTEFIAPNSCLITTEEIMLPILREAARTRGTSVRSVGWLQAGLLTGDVLQRFPYDEHPKNIAMVLEMANELGIDHDFALKEMADRVVPDLGVLKTYPTACMQTRKLIFTNGMAANERLGFMGNWERMGFDRHNTLEHPGTWISTVINNREDRLPRSKVFAEILVRDIHADCHFLIGSNLHGFLTYLQESWDEHYRLYSLWPETKAATAFSAAQTFEKQALRMGVAVSAAQLQQRLQAMLSGMGLDADTCRQYDTAQPAALQELLAQHELGNYETAAVDYLQRSQEELQVYLAFSAKLTNAAPTRQSALNREALDLLWSWLQSRIVVIDDVHASGNEIIDRICQHTPPGFSNRILGAQNIKGPGLDFVYRWQAWDSCYQACQLLSSREEDLAERGLQTLSAFQEYGPLCEEHVKQTLERVTHSEVAQTEHFQSVLGLLKTNLALQLQELKLRSEVSRVGHGWVAQAWLLLESFLDAGDAVKRRKRANRIYQDLINQQISHARAVLELQKLNKLQKGGWLQQRFTNWLSGIFY